MCGGSYDGLHGHTYVEPKRKPKIKLRVATIQYSDGFVYAWLAPGSHTKLALAYPNQPRPISDRILIGVRVRDRFMNVWINPEEQK